MAITWKVLGQAVLGGTAAALYTAAANTRASVSAAQLWNPTGSPVVVDVYLVRSGSAGDANKIDRVTVPATTAKTVFGLINQKLDPGASIQALGTGVTLTISGSESV